MTITKKICFISAGLAGGGMERALSSLANYYASNGHTVCILNLFKTEQFFEVHNAIKVIWPTTERKKFHRLAYALLIIPFVRKNIRNFNPDVMISFGEWFNPYVILTTRFLNIPLFISDRMGPELNIGPLLETSRKLLYKYATGIVAQTNISANIIKQKTNARNIMVIPNPVNIIETDISIKKDQIVTIGRLSREKGHIILIRAFAALTQVEWTLHIVGDGKERAALEKAAIELGIENRVFFYGHLKNFDQILGESRIFVLPSFYEGFPNALVEAMSVPLACISSDCVAGPGDIIDSYQNGILVPTGDVDALAKAMNLLISDNSLRNNLAEKAFEIRKKLKFEVIADRYLDFILSAPNSANA